MFVQLNDGAFLWDYESWTIVQTTIVLFNNLLDDSLFKKIIRFHCKFTEIKKIVRRIKFKVIQFLKIKQLQFQIQFPQTLKFPQNRRQSTVFSHNFSRCQIKSSIFAHKTVLSILFLLNMQAIWWYTIFCCIKRNDITKMIIWDAEMEEEFLFLGG